MAYAFVQQNANDNAASATTITVTLTPTAGNLLVFAISADSADTTSIALSDNLGTHNTFTQIGTDLVVTAAQRCAWWFAANCKGGATTFTATFSSSARFRTFYVAEYSGIATSSPFLNGARAENSSPGTGTDAVSSGTANATSQPALVWGFCIDASGNTTPTAGTGFTSRTGVWSTNTCLGRGEDKRVTATGNVAATFTATTGTDDHGTGIGIFLEAASPTGSAAGTSTVSGGGAALAAGTGTAAGTSTVAGASPSNSGVGSAAGTSTVSGGGAALVAGTGSVAGTSTVTAASNNIFPLTIHSSGRYLLQNNGTPFLIRGDTTWSLFVDIPLSGLNSFLTTITGQGFNAVSGNVIEHHYTTAKPPQERSGLLPFTQKMDGTSYTGSPNGTTAAAGTQGQFASDNYSNINTQAPDCTFINNSYWTQLETILNACLAFNVLVFVWPCYLGFHADDEGWMNEMVVWDATTGAGGFAGLGFADNTKSRMWNYGAWLAARWKSYPNLVWVMGGDYGSNTQTLSTSQASAVSNLMAGMKSVSGQQSLFFCAHWDRPALSTDTTLAAGSFDLNLCYCDDSVAELARRGYSTVAKPTFIGEYFYENDLFGGSAPYRKYMYWGYLGGIAGGLFGNEQLWRFDNGSPGTNYTTLLTTQATLDAQRQFTLWNTLPWQRLKPSGLGGMGTLVTAGGGTASPQSTDYVAAACTSEGDLLLAYVPPAHTGSVTIDMTKLAATAVARWFDPTNGTFTAIGAIANTGTHAFTTPGTNSAGDADFLLVLQTSVGTAAGTSSVAGVGAALAAAAGAATGVGTATGSGAATAAGTGAATGSSVVSGAAAVVLSGTGSAAGTGTATGVGAALAATTGAAAGAAGVSGTGAALDAGVGTTSGAGTVAGAGAALAASAGSAAGVSAVAGVGAALAAAAGTATGSASTSGVGTAFDAGVGVASGAATVAGTGAAIAAAAGAATGAGSLTGIAAVLAAGAATVAGSATVSGISGSPGAGAGAAAGSGTATGVGAAFAAGTSAVSGVGTVAAAGAALVAGAGSAAGVGTASGMGAGLTAGSGTGTVAGNSAVSGAGAAIAAGTGAVVGSAVVSGVSPANAGVGSAAGMATVLGAGASLGAAAGTLTGMASVTAVAPPAIDPTSAWENAIYQWVVTGSGLDGAQVIWADARNGGPRPTGLYISMKIIDVDQVSDDWNISRREGGGIVVHARGTRHPMLELTCFGGDSYGVKRAELVLARVAAALRLPSVMKALRAGDVGTGQPGKVRVVPGLRSGMLDARAVLEVLLHIKIDVSEPGGEFVSAGVTTPGPVAQSVSKG